MANTKSAEKRIRQSEDRRQRNRNHRTRMRTAVKKLRAVVADGDADTARELLPQTVSIVNHTAQRGVVHQNVAARTTSRLTKAVAALGQ